MVLAAVVCLGATGLWHSGGDDFGCDRIPVHHDHNAHRFRSGKVPTGASEHCLLCHAFRLLGSGRVTAHVHIADPASVAAIRTTTFHFATLLVTAGTASRAPPAILL